MDKQHLKSFIKAQGLHLCYSFAYTDTYSDDIICKVGIEVPFTTEVPLVMYVPCMARGGRVLVKIEYE